MSVKENKIVDVGGERGMITLENGEEYGPFDAIVMATGFDAMTGSVLRIEWVSGSKFVFKLVWILTGFFSFGWTVFAAKAERHSRKSGRLDRLLCSVL